MNDDVAVNEELQVTCPLCGARRNKTCQRHDREPGSHPERAVELLLHRARNGNGLVGYELWNAVKKASGEIPEGRRQTWEKHYLPEVKKLCGFAA